MKNYILDANIFFNMEAGLGMGEKTQDVIINVTKYAEALRLKQKGEFFMPPAVVDEFLSFFEDKNQDVLKKLLASITTKSPDHLRSSFPASVFYQLIGDIRARSYRGLAVGEEELVRVGETMSGKKFESKKDFQIAVGDGIKKFRDRYRQATRHGFLDSIADLDIIVLAKELSGSIVSCDEGVVYWGRVFGVKEIRAEVWRTELESLLHQG